MRKQLRNARYRIDVEAESRAGSEYSTPGPALRENPPTPSNKKNSHNEPELKKNRCVEVLPAIPITLLIIFRATMLAVILAAAVA